MLSSPLNATVKELTRSAADGAVVFPSIYITRGPAEPEPEPEHEPVTSEEIPTVDLFRLRNGDPNERSRIVADIGRACEDWGCFKVVNHGVTESLQAAVIEAFGGFFDLPEQEKEVYGSKDHFSDPISHGSSTTLFANNVRFWRDYLKLSVYPVFNCPPKPTNFRKISEEFARRTKEICDEIMKAILRSLDLNKENSIEESNKNPASCTQFLLGNLYPPCPKSELAMGLPPHRDPMYLTLLMQNDASFNGLQVLHHNKWTVVDLRPPSFFLLIGDIMEIVSNGRYKSAVHRAMVSNERTRISVSASIMPAENDVLSPALKLLERSEEPAKFRPITYKEFVKLKYMHKEKISIMDLIKC